MSLPSGHRLGPYEIVAPLGAGGMGEVYRALDVRLRREVAVKVLPAAFAGDADRLRRFEQEARASAALAHPGVVSVHDFGVEQGAPYLVTELLTGSTLRELVESGPLAPARALDLARQALDALAAAHERGIVHRDLKPENLFLTREGRLKILDFGLARLVEGQGADLATAPTQVGLTQSGVIVGTIGYMAPEQVQGERVDHRADLFAVGVVLYELLTGRRAFAAKSAVDTLHAILNAEPEPVARLVSGLPAGIDPVLRRCLAKSPAARFQSARDLAFALELAGTESATGAGAAVPPSRSRRWLLAGGAAAVAATLLAVLSFGGRTARRETPPATPFTTGVLTPLTTDPGYEAEASFLPDGETLVYTSDRTGDYDIYLQQVSGGAAINLTRDPADDVQPAISPDGRSIAFVSSRSSRFPIAYSTPRLGMTGGDIWVMPVLGGLARKVAEHGNFPTWSPDGATIYFLRGIWFSSEIRRVSASGGASEVVPVELAGNQRFLLQLRLSPDGRRLAFQSGDAILTAPTDGGPATIVGLGRDAIWTPDGRALLYCNAVPGRNFSLWRQAVDSEGRAVGAAEALLTGPAALATPAIARSGRRLAIAAVERTSNLEELPLDAESGRVLGAARELIRGRNEVAFATLSPDGRSIIYDATRGASNHLWRLDAGGEPVQLTNDARFSESFPRWSPDGSRIAFTRRLAGEPRRPSNAAMWTMSPDGSDPRRVLEQGGSMAWLPDSRRLVVVHLDTYKLVDTVTGAATPIPIDGPEPTPVFAVSPDGGWLVYNSRQGEDGDLAIVPTSGGKARLLNSAGWDGHPSFSPTGRWLYFQAPTHRNLWRVPGPAQGWRPAPREPVTHFAESGLFLEEPLIAPDGRRLVYSRVLTSADVWIVDADESPTSPRP